MSMEILIGLPALLVAILAVSIVMGIIENRRLHRLADERRGMQPSRIPPRLFAFGIIVSVPGAWAFGADKAPAVAIDDMRRHALLLAVDSLSDDGRHARVEILPDALLRYTDPARRVAEGSLWAWGGPGRPLAILEVEKYPHRPDATRWLHGLVSLSTGLIACTWDDGRRWESTEPGLSLGPVPDAPAPATSERVRLAQMKDIARRFAVREDAGPIKGKITLRLLPSPVCRYSDPGSGLQDGAIFVFASGTNPEALLILESRPSNAAAPVWQSSFARITGGALAADLDGHEIWTRSTEANPPHSGPAYMNRWHPVLPESE